MTLHTRIDPAQIIRLTGMPRMHDGDEVNGSAHRESANDPLAGMTPKQIWTDCVWLSGESTATKLMLLCIGRFFDADARSSSMSYAQVARECALHESTAKRIAKAIIGKWLAVGVHKGFKTGSGPQNLYHGITPPDLVSKLREQRRSGEPVDRDAEIEAEVETVTNRLEGVASCDPSDGKGAPDETPCAHKRVKGSPHATRTPITPILTIQRSGADAPPSRVRKPKADRLPPTRLPPDWCLPEGWREYPRERGLSERQIDALAREFHRYWTGPDAKSPAKRDWKRVWENRVDAKIDTYGLKPEGRFSSVAASDIEAEVQRRLGSDIGRLLMGTIGTERAREQLRSQILRERGGAHG